MNIMFLGNAPLGGELKITVIDSFDGAQKVDTEYLISWVSPSKKEYQLKKMNKVRYLGGSKPELIAELSVLIKAILAKEEADKVEEEWHCYCAHGDCCRDCTCDGE